MDAVLAYEDVGRGLSDVRKGTGPDRGSCPQSFPAAHSGL
jgi:hypothetical protein